MIIIISIGVTVLFFRIWQGKAVLGAIFIPLIIYLMARIKTESNV